MPPVAFVWLITLASIVIGRPRGGASWLRLKEPLSISNILLCFHQGVIGSERSINSCHVLFGLQSSRMDSGTSLFCLLVVKKPRASTARNLKGTSGTASVGCETKPAVFTPATAQTPLCYPRPKIPKARKLRPCAPDTYQTLMKERCLKHQIETF